MRLLLSALAAISWLAVGVSTAQAAATVDFQVTGPATAPHGSELTMALQYSVTGDDLQDLVIVYDLPAGLVPLGASSTGDFVTSCQSQDPTTNRDWSCTFTASSLAVPPGGVSGQIAITTKLVPFMFGHNEVVQSEATFSATDGGATPIGPLSSTHDITTTGTLSFQENFTWSVDNNDYAFRADPNGDVGVVTEVYYALTQLSDTRIEPGAQMTISLPTHGRYIAGPELNVVNGSPSLTAPPKWQSGDLVIDFADAYGQSYVGDCDGFACNSISVYRTLLLPIQVWLPCPDLATPPATPATVSLVGEAAGISPGVETLVSNTVAFAQSGAGIYCGDPLSVGVVFVAGQTVGFGQDAAMTMVLAPPIGEVPVTDAFASMRLPEQIVARGVKLNFGSETGQLDAPNGFQVFGCTVPAETGPFDLAAFQGGYQLNDCVDVTATDGSIPADTTHIAMYAANWQGVDADGPYVPGPIRAYFDYTNNQCDTSADEIFEAAAEATISTGVQTSTSTQTRPVQETAYPALSILTGNNGIVTRGTATTLSLFPNYSGVGSPLINPEFTIDLPAGVALTNLTAPPGFPNCATATSANDALTWSGPAVGPAIVTVKVGSAAAPFLYDKSCANNTCGGGTFSVVADLFFDAAHPFLNGEQVVIPSTMTADNPSIGAPPSVPAVVQANPTFTVQVPGEMRVVVSPTCSAENSNEGFRFAIENVGGIGLTNVTLTVPIPNTTDGSGTAADMQFVDTAGTGAVECRTNAGPWSATCDATSTEVRVNYPAIAAHTTIQWDLFVAPIGAAPAGTIVRALGDVTANELLNLDLQESAPLKTQQCPGALHIDGWYDGDVSGDRQPSEQGLNNWTVELTDQATSIVTAIGLPASGIVDTTVAPGTYDVVIVPASNEPTWTYTTAIPATVTIASGGSAEILIGVGCSCDDGLSCSTDSCSPTGQCIYELPPEGCCGNGEIDPGEVCDDTNTDPFDGCDQCQCPPYGWQPDAAGGCAPVCGDGLLMGGEACDDANIVDGDGCSSTCTVENNFACVEADDSCLPSVVCAADKPDWCTSGAPEFAWCQDLSSSTICAGGPLDCSGPSLDECIAANGGSSDPCQDQIVCSFCEHIGPSVCTPDVDPCAGAEALAVSCPAAPADPVECTGATTNVTLADATTTGGCGQVTVSNDAPDAYGLGVTTVNYTAVDETPATETCETVVTVVDTTAPELTCPADITVPATPATCTGDVQLDNAVATDLCDAAPTVSNDAPSSFPLGASTVTYEVSDSSGNTATCETQVTVTVPPPALTCEAAVTLTAPPEACGATQVLEAIYTAGCGPAASLGVDSDLYPVGSTDVDFEVAQEGSDALTCTTVVTVQDVTPPTVDCGTPGSLGFIRSWPYEAVGTGADACGVRVAVSAARCLAEDGSEVACEATLNGAAVSFAEPADAAAVTTVEWVVTATDDAGLTASETCSATVDIPTGPVTTPTCEPGWVLNEDGVCDRILATGGGGCSSSDNGSAPWAVALALLALVGLNLRRRRSGLENRGTKVVVIAATAALGVTTMAPSKALAQQGHVPAQLFQIAPGGALNYLGTESIRPLGHIEPSFGLSLNYAYQPLVLTRQSNGEQVDILEHQLQADVTAAIGFFDVIELGLAMPVTLYQAPGSQGQTVSPAGLSSTVAGDLFIGLKAKLFGPEFRKGFGMGLLAGLTVPTGSAENLQGNGGVTIEPRVLAEYVFSPQVRLAAGLGYKVRLEKQTLYNIEVGNEVTYSMGFEWQPLPQELAVLLDLNGRIGADPDITASFEERPSELALAARWWPAENHALTFGVSRGLSQGYGAPAVRGFIGYQFTPMPEHDRDKDGLPDDVDACPDDPEDFDEFEDTDGCPDLDNDKDGIVDTADKCPLKPEDKDGFEDADGCPELDNDGDGLLDSADQCPLKPEDKDGYQDNDGCPEDDNDGDGILDNIDKCPNEAEDKDGFQDDDGCPDGDNDGDGLLDPDDPCPNDKTNACKAVKKGKKIIIYDKVHFKYNKAVIKKKSYPVLDDVLDILKKNPSITKVQVQGHTDSDGNDAFNLRLSDRRAAAVVSYLVERGIAKSRLTSIGYGERRALKPNNTKANRAENRRVEFHILESGGVEMRPKKR